MYEISCRRIKSLINLTYAFSPVVIYEVLCLLEDSFDKSAIYTGKG